MAEIEHFCDPADKSHAKFKTVAEEQLTLYTACNQMDGELPKKWRLGDAVEQVKKNILNVFFLCSYSWPCCLILNDWVLRI